MSRPTRTMPGAELVHPGKPGEGLLPGLHFANIYGESLCARHCAGHWGHRDERDTLSTHPGSSPPSLFLLGPVPELCTEGGTKDRTMLRKAQPRGPAVRTPGFMSTTHRLLTMDTL